jgi:CheY-like chemotaxis protein
MEAVGQLAGGVAHEFNNRLTAITNCGYILKMKLQPDEPLRVYAEQILASAEKAASLTQSLLAFSRKQVINPKAVRVNDIVRGVEKFLHRVIGADIELVTEFLDEEMTVLADVGQIEQVLLNMATNARDAMPGGGYLHIGTERVETADDPSLSSLAGGRGAYAVISVSDTGEGMEESRREKIFEPFFTTKGVGKGTGLGLSIAYGIIKQHGGHITVQSESGEGTNFRIFIPLTESEAGEVKSREAPVPEGGRETVLLAEDDSDVRRFTRRVLEEFGYRVIEAVDGEDAIKVFRENRDSVKLLLTDVVMPRKNGREVYSEISRECPGIRSLFISGYAADVISDKGMLQEGQHFITKPVSPGELLRRVREELDSV